MFFFNFISGFSIRGWNKVLTITLAMDTCQFYSFYLKVWLHVPVAFSLFLFEGVRRLQKQKQIVWPPTYPKQQAISKEWQAAPEQSSEAVGVGGGGGEGVNNWIHHPTHFSVLSLSSLVVLCLICLPTVQFMFVSHTWRGHNITKNTDELFITNWFFKVPNSVWRIVAN